MNSRAAVYALFILALVGIDSVLVWALVRFATPQPEYVEIGRLFDIPPSAQPNFLYDPLPVYVLNDNEALLALESLSGVPGGAPVRWWSEGQAYIDPSRDTWFDRYGNPFTTDPTAITRLRNKAYSAIRSASGETG